jgi:hypothetical protein
MKKLFYRVTEIRREIVIIIAMVSLSMWTCEKNSSSQYISPFPTLKDNPSWTISISYSNPDQEDYVEIYSYAYDTSFCNKSYTKVIAKNNNDVKRLCYIRIDGIENKVYIRKTNNCNENEYLLYSFNVAENQSVMCGFNLGNVFPDTELEFNVIHVDSVKIDNIQRRRFAIKYFITTYEYEMTWIEGVGSIENPFYPVTLSKAPGAGINQLNSFKVRDKELLKF